MTIHEIQEAAKVITESIDKDAKVIFGTILDEKLKKGELKVTVIATNFPADTPRGKSLFGVGENVNQTLLKEDNAALVKKEINNSINNMKGGNLNNSKNKNDFIKKTDNKPIKDIVIEDDSSDRSAVPAFLRRKK